MEGFNIESICSWSFILDFFRNCRFIILTHMFTNILTADASVKLTNHPRAQWQCASCVPAVEPFHNCWLDFTACLRPQWYDVIWHHDFSFFDLFEFWIPATTVTKSLEVDPDEELCLVSLRLWSNSKTKQRYQTRTKILFLCCLFLTFAETYQILLFNSNARLFVTSGPPYCFQTAAGAFIGLVSRSAFC